jgi:hypothetical protein
MTRNGCLLRFGRCKLKREIDWRTRNVSPVENGRTRDACYYPKSRLCERETTRIRTFKQPRGTLIAPAQIDAIAARGLRRV